MKGRTIHVLHGPHKSGPCCVLCSYKGYSGPRCYCNPANAVTGHLVHDEPLDQPVSCQVCEHYRQRLVRFWSQGGETALPQGSEGQRA